MKRFSHVEDESQLKEIVYLAKEQDAIIIYTLVKSSMRRKLKEECASIGYSLHRSDWALL